MTRLAVILTPLMLSIAFAIGCRLVPTETRRQDTTKTADNVASSIALQFKETVRGREYNPGPGGTVPTPVVVMSSPVPAAQPLTITGSSNVNVRVEPAPVAPSYRTVQAAPISSAADAVPYFRETEASAGAGVNASSNSDAHTEQATSIPLGVKLTLIGIGLAAIVGALVFAWKHIRTTALGQGIAAADSILANRIRAARARATTSRDAEEIAKAMAEVADLEAERGRIKR